MTGSAKWTTSKGDNWDSIFHRVLETATTGQERLTWHIAQKDWKQTFRIKGYGFLATHGDMIKRYYSMPYYGMSRQSQRWAVAYRRKIKLEHFIFGHFHSIDTGQRFNDLWIYVNGSFVTDDSFAEEQIGVTSHAEQLLMGIHKRFGVTWRFPIQLD